MKKSTVQQQKFTCYKASIGKELYSTFLLTGWHVALLPHPPPQQRLCDFFTLSYKCG